MQNALKFTEKGSIELGIDLRRTTADDVEMIVVNVTDTGMGIKDASYETEILGTGFSVGKMTSISVAGSSVGIDFGRVFDSIF